MDWLIQLFQTQDSVAHIVLLYSIVIALGVYLGKIKIGGISLGVTFVLFVTAPYRVPTIIGRFLSSAVSKKMK